MSDFIITYPRTELNPNGDPLPTQEAFHKSKAKYRFLVGGWGTGKTTSVCLEMLLKDISIPNNYILFGRKDLQELKSTTLKELEDMTPKEMVISHNRTERIITYVNGTELFYTNLDESREAFNKIASLNLGAAVIDQGEELTEKVFTAIRGRLRRKQTIFGAKEFRRCFYGAYNPEGHNYQYKLCIQEPIANMEHFEATSLENVYLPQDYLDELLLLPDKIKKRYVYCSYDDFEGLVYNEFTEKLNVMNYYEPQKTDSHYIIFDYGFRNPACILFAAVNYDGEAIIYKENYGSGKRISDLAADIKTHPFFNQAYKLADPSIWNVQRDGMSVGDDFNINHQIYFNKADNSVSQGIDKVNTLLKKKRLYICKSCENTLREIGNYKWKELKPGQQRNEYEEPIKKDDHAMDSIRYFVNYIWTPIKPPEKKQEQPGQGRSRLELQEKEELY